MSLFVERAVTSLLLIFTIAGVCFFTSTHAAPTATPTESEYVHMESVPHKQNNCTARRVARYNVSHDIACVLDKFELTTSNFLLSLAESDMQCNRIIYGNNSFPEKYRALLDIISLFETTNLAVQNFNQSLCELKSVISPNLNDTVGFYCNCPTNSGGCTSRNVTAVANGSTGHSEQCLLYNLELILKDIRMELGGDDVTCKRANATQHQVLLNFNKTVNAYHDAVTPREISEILAAPLLPAELCYYADTSLAVAVRSLHALAPYMNDLTALEARHLSGNITEAVLPVVQQLLGTTRFEEIVSSSTPFTSDQEETFQALAEETKTRCLVQKLDLICMEFIEALTRELYIHTNSCASQTSS